MIEDTVVAKDWKGNIKSIMPTIDVLGSLLALRREIDEYTKHPKEYPKASVIVKIDACLYRGVS